MDIETKTDRRILKTKKAITEAFLELFSDKEIEQITINEIAERANVNRGTVYLHYTDKYDLLNQCINEHLNKMFIYCKDNGMNPENSNMFHMLEIIFTYFQKNYMFFSSMLSSKTTIEFRERMLQFIVSNINEKINAQKTKHEMDTELLTQFLASAFVGTVEWWIVNKMPHSPQYMAENLGRLFEKQGYLP
ncbi:TetR/AcrR family transcriptional regulator [Sutcliffiella halmapala]|uniref:TetR/AcrR family transcriptional regulator n=1 Tax=Sutcliffiella halmapala TaxID=79882 RepID=UPI00147357E1|nr:TetR/AcrR family transcriptional regulator [Sutcliffiella halmapala]